MGGAIAETRAYGGRDDSVSEECRAFSEKWRAVVMNRLQNIGHDIPPAIVYGDAVLELDYLR